jgi:hypothetical protein
MRVLSRVFAHDLSIFPIQQSNVRAIAVEGATDRAYEAFDESAKFDLPGRLRSESGEKLKILGGYAT